MMDNTPRGNRLHIAILGRRNTGKSSLINALTGQQTSLVSEVPGTTTDPVFKAMEILPLGPVVIIDTAGIDDEGILGKSRVKRTHDVLRQADLVILTIDPQNKISSYEKEMVNVVRGKKLPLLGVLNKSDLLLDPGPLEQEIKTELGLDAIVVSALDGSGMEELKNALIKEAPRKWDEQKIVGDLLNNGDLVVLVAPIDSAAPKSRLILPQVQTIRDVIDHGAMSLVVQPQQLPQALNSMRQKPRLVITDAQAFTEIDQITPPDIPLTSFSILFARYKGDLTSLVSGVKSIERLKPGDKVLMAESCTHHRAEDDIGKVKIPRWLKEKVGDELQFAFTSGNRFPEDLSEYRLIIHCGGCMINRREMVSRISQAETSGIPIINYGVCIAYLKGILPRALSPFPGMDQLLQEEYV